MGEPQILGLHELYNPGKSAQADIVAVHGLNGNAIKTWTKGKTCWLSEPDFLPKYVPNARILAWGYNANAIAVKGGSTSSDRILQHAQSLVAQLAGDRELENAPLRPLIFLCHSLGGIVVKRALAYSESRKSSKLTNYHNIYNSTYGIIFFGTPHDGASKAHLLSILEKLVSMTISKKIIQTDSALVRALQEDSETLQNITDQFVPLMHRFCIFFLWEQERSDLKYTKEYIVEESSAAPLMSGETERCGVAADHQGMCKFDSRQDQGFRMVAAALKRYVGDAENVIKGRHVIAGESLKVRNREQATELVKTTPGGARSDMVAPNNTSNSIVEEVETTSPNCVKGGDFCVGSR